ncbi:MAG: N-acetylmuramoyl-L-alanine amidase [Lachnospiraceae bacterium]|nr:N-acetylmuramoyl-L-alanine amidase [Lachnospiraceae bacterium]
MRKKLKINLMIIFLVILSGIFLGQRYFRSTESKKVQKSQDKQVKEEQAEKKGKKEKIHEQTWVEGLHFTRISNREIKLLWTDQKNSCVDTYVIKKRKSGESEWRTLGTVISDGMTEGRELSFVDFLEDSTPQQYEYRVDIEVADERLYQAVEGESVFASNLLICIDPGHYKGRNVIDTDGIVYDEGVFTLELAIELQKLLREQYGVTAYLTRESGTIHINGYTDSGLDNGHISLRGEYAKGSDLFLSLHTNANLEKANGYETDEQPVEIMKPIIIMNTTACESETALAIGNAIGERLAEISNQLEIAMPEKFHKISGKEDIVQWSDAWNDALDGSGAICKRLGKEGDYYGVLKGAANVQVLGMIIEHGFHTVPKMRELAKQGILQKEWAKADAKGIAKGFELEAAK